VARVQLVRFASGGVTIFTPAGNITGLPYDAAITQAKRLLGVSLLDVDERTKAIRRV
jgi:hypothetical protein